MAQKLPQQAVPVTAATATKVTARTEIRIAQEEKVNHQQTTLEIPAVEMIQETQVTAAVMGATVVEMIQETQVTAAVMAATVVEMIQETQVTAAVMAATVMKMSWDPEGKRQQTVIGVRHSKNNPSIMQVSPSLNIACMMPINSFLMDNHRDNNSSIHLLESINLHAQAF